MTIFGLGNPGSAYRWTRHNAGFILVDTVAKKHRRRFVRRGLYSCTSIIIKDKRIFLVKPLSFMNRSGIPVARFLTEHSDDFLVVVDDLNLPLGKLRIRSKGSDGGHLGLRSIIQTLKTESFPRLRIGIGSPAAHSASCSPHSSTREETDAGGTYAEYVLGRFGKKEKTILAAVIRRAIMGIEMLVSGNFEKAQNFMNAVDDTKVHQDNR